MPEEEKSDGFKFAVTLLASLGTILYTEYNYFQNESVNIYLYSFAIALVPVALIFLFLLLLYVLIKGYSMEVKAPDKKECLKNRASNIYLWTFFMITAFLTYFLIFFLLIYTNIHIPSYTNFFLMLIGYYNCIFCFRFAPPKREPVETKNCVGYYSPAGDFSYCIGYFLVSSISTSF